MPPPPLELTREEQEENEWREMRGLPPTPDYDFFLLRIARAIGGAAYDAPIIVNYSGYHLIRLGIAANMSFQQSQQRMRENPPVTMLLGHLVQVKIHSSYTEAPTFEIEQKEKQ